MKETRTQLPVELAGSKLRMEQGLKTPLQSETVPILRALSSPVDGYDGNIPTTALSAIRREVAGLLHGTASLTLHVKDGHLLRFVTSREISHVPAKQKTGGHNGN